jgi:hypothetical protein
VRRIFDNKSFTPPDEEAEVIAGAKAPRFTYQSGRTTVEAHGVGLDHYGACWRLRLQ